MTTPDPPQSVPSASQDQLADALKKMLSVVTTAQRLIRDRQAVDLTGLDRKVAELCESIAALPPDQARSFAAPLEALVEALDDLDSATRQAMEARAWLWRGPGGITPMRRRTDVPPAGVVASAYSIANRARRPLPESGTTEEAEDAEDSATLERRATDRAAERPRGSPDPEA